MPELDPYRCQATTTGFDFRLNQCALAPGHAGAHRNRSGRIKWTDDGDESVRLHDDIGDPLHRRFGEVEDA